MAGISKLIRKTSCAKIYIAILCFLAISCKNHYNDAIEWMDNLEPTLTIIEVQQLQPEFIEIDWEEPLKVDDEKWYLVTKIDGNKDVLGMSHYLTFDALGYDGRVSKK